jgi:hypothetical protein
VMYVSHSDIRYTSPYISLFPSLNPATFLSFKLHLSISSSPPACFILQY